VVNPPHGDDRNQFPPPQSMAPAGYCPVSGRSCPERPSKIAMPEPPAGAVAVGAGGVGVGVFADGGVGVGDCAGVFVAVAV
jgi:hypothetical protein